MVPYRDLLLRGAARIGVWGTGYIGYSTMVNFAATGVRCLGTDINPTIVATINEGRVPLPNMEFWLGFDPREYPRMGLLRSTMDWKELLAEDVLVHIIAVPTERGAEPWFGALEDVVRKISDGLTDDTGSKKLVVVESTLSPGTTERIILPILREAGLTPGKDLLLGVAPRRDWFGTSDKNLKNLPRIVGGTTLEATEAMEEVFRIVCDKVHRATDHRHAEMVKAVENAYRHVEITLANQLTRAFPDLNITEVLRLAGTKWNIGTYHPSFGTGGYCIPLSSRYLIQDEEKAEYLSILREAIRTDDSLPGLVAESLARYGVRSVGILGLAYKGDLKVHILSPTVKMAERLRELGVLVKINDPYYSESEIKAITGAETFEFPDGLEEFEAIVIVAGHRRYSALPSDTILRRLKKCKVVLDNMEEAWRKVDFSGTGIEYHVSGDANWLLGHK